LCGSRLLEPWKNRVKRLKVETYALYLAGRDPRVPWYAKALAVCVVAYAFSPVDLIPDFIPVLGYLDDLVLVPLGILLALKMIPPDVLRECREKAIEATSEKRPRNWVAGGIIVAVWLLLATLTTLVAVRAFKD